MPRAGDGHDDVARLAPLVAPPPDFPCLDGPLHDRSGLMRRTILLDLCSGADLIVIDDIQTGHIYDQMVALQDLGKKRHRTVIDYEIWEEPDRFLGVLTRQDLQPVVGELIDVLGVPTVAH